MKHKERLDVLLVSLGLAESRANAQATIMAGEVYVNGQKADKSGMEVDITSNVEVRGSACPYVSRGGLKLQKAIDTYQISLKDRVCVDIGASTGGFTDCMLMHGAKKVFAVDVGYGQLDWKLRNDERVVCMERHNARFMNLDWFDEQPSFASIDVSFISIGLIIPRLNECLSTGGAAAVLVKPQFEAGRDKIGKNGVVRDKKTHIEVLTNAIEHVRSNGFSVHGIEFSPITGPKGNIEFLLYLGHEENAAECGMGETELAEAVEKTVSDAHTTLK